MWRRAFIALGLVLATAPGAQADEVAVLVQQVVRGGPGEARAVERLRFLGPERSGPALRALLVNGGKRERIAAASALAVVRDPGSAPALIKALEDEDWPVRRSAAQALGAMRHRAATKALETRLGTDPNTRVRKACADALGRIGTGSGGLAKAALGDADLEVRLLALDLLASRADAKVARRLRPLLDDPSALVQFAAARSLAWAGDASARSFLLRQVSANEAESARRAVTAVADVPRSWAVDLLAGALEHADAEVRFEAAVALTRRDDERGIRPLVRTAGGVGDEAVRARSMLEQLGVSHERRQAAVGNAP